MSELADGCRIRGHTSDKLVWLGFIKCELILGVLMKIKPTGYVVAAIMAVLMLLAGCNQAPVRSDAQVATEVRNRIDSDAAIESREVGVQSANGIVTLSGNVDREEERTAAARDAATVEGVKTVINNLTVQQAAQPPVVDSSSGAAADHQTGERRARRLPPAPVTVARKNESGGLAMAAGTGNVQSGDQPAPAPEPVAAQAPAPPPPPKKVTIPAGTQITVRLNDPLDSERNQVGDSFHGTLGAPIVIDDETVIPLGADVVGRVVDVKSAGRFAGNSVLTLELTSLSMNGKTYNIQTNQWSRQGKGEGKNTAIKAGGGAALGAIVGGIAGGGKGAAIGTVAGAGAGTGVAATKKGEQIKLGSESTLSFLLINTLTVTQQTANNHNAGRTPLQ
jgi:hypothetical protein